MNVYEYHLPIFVSEGLCDFEEGDCGWIQQADDDLNWIRVSGNNVKSKSRPGFDHTTNTASGSYFYMESAPTHVQGHRAIMTSPLLRTGERQLCIFQLPVTYVNY